MLKVTGLKVFYGHIQAVHGVDFEVNQGEIVTIIGANGAGKTSILRGLSGIAQSKGHIKFLTYSISPWPVQKRVSYGLVMVPEGRGIFGNLTVSENLDLGGYLRQDRLLVSKDQEMVYELFPKLKERQNQLAGTLSGGEQQMLAIGRALMANPKLLILDEPSMGLAPLVVKDIFDLIVKLQNKGCTILLVEQNARLALKIAHRAYVLESGKFVKQGMAKDLIQDHQIISNYLGRS